jgi:protein-disulfide isomerase
MFNEDQKQAGGMTLSPKASFTLGLIGGMLVLCTIGFFILLSMVLKGSVTLGSGGGSGNQIAAAPYVPPAAMPEAGAPEPVGDVKPISDDDHVRGSKNAKVVLYEWSDFECPFCGRFHPTMLQLMDEYEGKVAWVYRHFPLSFHPSAEPAALAAECAAEQGKFWEFADELFANQTRLGDALYAELVADLKLNKAKFDSCMSEKKYLSKVNAQFQDGSAAGVSGTPGTVIVAPDGSKQLVPGAVPYAQLKAMVDAALAAN